MKRIMGWIVAAFAVSSVQAASLVSVGVLDTDNPFSEVRAVSADGLYVVGRSTALVVVNGTTGETGLRDTPFVWSAGTGTVQLPNPSGNHSMAYGVSAGIGSNFNNIIISGLHEGLLANRYYKAPLSDLGSGSWSDSGTIAGIGGANLQGGTSNNLRSDPFIGDGRWYIGGIRGDNGRAARLRGDPFIGWDGTNVRSVNSVSAAGAVVGRDNANPSNAFWEQPNVGFFTVPGGDGIRTDGFGISSSFGKSQTEDFEVQWICGQNGSLPDGQFEAFRWKRGDASLERLGTLPGHTSSVAYTVADNGITAGRSYVSGGETAVVWDTTGNWDPLGSGTAQSVQALLEDRGVDTSAWTRLVRVYAVSDDGGVLAGFGIWAADGSTRGFVATIGDIQVVGGCCVTTALGTGTCSMTTEQQCADTPHGTYLGDGIPCGPNGANCGDFCPEPFADADVDGDVDQADFGRLQRCLDPLGIPEGCVCYDRDDSGDVGVLDLQAFSLCATGPDIPFDMENPPPGCIP